MSRQRRVGEAVCCVLYWGRNGELVDFSASPVEDEAAKSSRHKVAPLINLAVISREMMKIITTHLGNRRVGNVLHASSG